MRESGPLMKTTQAWLEPRSGFGGGERKNPVTWCNGGPT